MPDLSVRVSPDLQIPNPYLLMQALMQAPQSSIPKNTTLAVVVSAWKDDGDSSGYKVSCYRDHELIGSFDLANPAGLSRRRSSRRSSSRTPDKRVIRASPSRVVSRSSPSQTEFRFGPLIYETRRTDHKQTSRTRQESEWVEYSDNGRVQKVVKMGIQNTREWRLDGEPQSRCARYDDWLDMGPIAEAMGLFHGMMSGDTEFEPLFAGSRGSRRAIEYISSDSERDWARERERIKCELEQERAEEVEREEERKKKKARKEEEKRRKEEEEAEREHERKKRAEEKKQKEEERKKKDDEKQKRKEARREGREQRAAERKQREERRSKRCDCDSCKRDRQDSGSRTRSADEDKKKVAESKESSSKKRATTETKDTKEASDNGDW